MLILFPASSAMYSDQRDVNCSSRKELKMAERASVMAKMQAQVKRPQASGSIKREGTSFQRKKCNSRLDLCSEKSQSVMGMTLHSPGTSPGSSKQDFAAPVFGYSFSQISVHSRSPASIQTKLTVNTPGDPYEQEADAIAYRVMVMKDSPVSRLGVRRGCVSCAGSDQFALHRISKVERDTIPDRFQSETHEDNMIVQLHTRDSSMEPGTTTSELTCGGSPLPEATRQFYEARMGYDFSAVSLHLSDRASQLNRALSARAFTYRNHIWLGPNEKHSPSLTLAHELVHVMQQTSPGTRGPNGTLSAPSSIQRDLMPPGNCNQGIHDQMQRVVKAFCDHASGRKCTPYNSCHRLKQKIRRNQLCAQHRRTINDLCYEGGDKGHRDAERDARRAQASCMEIYRIKCEPPPSPPVPVPERVPLLEPRPVPTGPIERMGPLGETARGPQGAGGTPPSVTLPGEIEWGKVFGALAVLSAILSLTPWGRLGTLLGTSLGLLLRRLGLTLGIAIASTAAAETSAGSSEGKSSDKISGEDLPSQETSRPSSTKPLPKTLPPAGMTPPSIGKSPRTTIPPSSRTATSQRKQTARGLPKPKAKTTARTIRWRVIEGINLDNLKVGQVILVQNMTGMLFALKVIKKTTKGTVTIVDFVSLAECVHGECGPGENYYTVTHPYRPSEESAPVVGITSPPK